MFPNGIPARADQAQPEPIHTAHVPLTRWQKLRLVIKMLELRLRFVAIMAITGLVFAYWDTIWNRYEKWKRPPAAPGAAVMGIEFFCPMHPQVVQEEPGSCPICGMPLARRQKGARPVLPEGATARVVLTPSRVDQAGIKTVEVEYAPLTETLTTVGYVAFDERRMANIVSKVPGKSRVEKLHVNVTGQNVDAGQPLAELYSPELAQATQELLVASRRAAAAVEPQSELGRSLLSDQRELLRAAAEKLKRWGITQHQVDAILASGKSDFTLPILSPTSGHVFKKNVVEGQEVPEGYPMFEVVDLGTVWVQAHVYEHQLGLIHEGQAAVATFEAFPGERFAGKLEFIQPHLDQATRTVEVRYALENPGQRLRPGMFATVTLEIPVAELPAFRARVAAKASSDGATKTQSASLSIDDQKDCPVTRAKLGSMGDPIPVQVGGRKVWTCCAACPPKLKAQPARYLAWLPFPPRDQVLSVPESAVIDTGTRQIVYVEVEPGVYEGRAVILGPRSGDRFPVLEGLGPGEKIAAAGAFLIDAESRLNAAPAAATPGDASAAAEHDPTPSGTPAASERHRH
jgi:Cu(I)/Ag(I) efflux system membrane fusion protein